jgi:hypothetical protein
MVGDLPSVLVRMASSKATRLKHAKLALKGEITGQKPDSEKNEE